MDDLDEARDMAARYMAIAEKYENQVTNLKELLEKKDFRIGKLTRRLKAAYKEIEQLKITIDTLQEFKD